MGYHLAFGPIDLLEYIRTTTDGVENQLLTETWCEGSLILNLDKNEVLFYDGLVGSESVFLKDALIEMYTETTWENWKISWAMNGQADIANYLGIPRELVNKNIESIPNRPKFSLDFPKHLNTNLLVMVNEGNFEIKLTPWHLETFLNVDLEEGMNVQKNIEIIDYQNIDRTHVYEFLFIDEKNRQLDVFYSYPFFVEEKLFVLERLKDWNIQFRHEGYRWLDNRLGGNFELRKPEIQGVKECFDHVFINGNHSNHERQKKYYTQMSIDRYKDWILKSKYYP